MSDINLIPKKEAITYLERESYETELTRSLIKLIELGLVDAVYQEGHIAYQAKGDPFTAFVTIWSNKSEQEIKTILPKLRKITDEYKEERKTPFKKGMISEPLIEALKNASNLTACEIKSIRVPALEKHYKNECFSKILEYFSILSERETRLSNTKINELIIEIKKLLEEEERKILKDERWINQFIELFEKFSKHSVPEVKRILSEVRTQLEEK